MFTAGLEPRDCREDRQDAVREEDRSRSDGCAAGSAAGSQQPGGPWRVRSRRMMWSDYNQGYIPMRRPPKRSLVGSTSRLVQQLNGVAQNFRQLNCITNSLHWARENHAMAVPTAPVQMVLS